MSDFSAVDLVANPSLGIDPITATISSGKPGYSNDELAHFRVGKDDMHSVLAKIYNYGEKGNQDIKRSLRRFLTDAVFEDSIDMTPTFTLTMHDPDWELINNGALEHTIDINPGKTPHRWYRYTGFSVNDDDLTLIFSTRNAVYLMGKHRPRHSNRKKVTRAQFILSLVREVKEEHIKFFCPQLKQKQKIGRTVFPAETERKNAREKGFSDSDKVTVKGTPATRQQKQTIEQVIAGGVDVKAPSLVVVSAVMCIIQESNAGAHTGGNPPYVGSFQQNRAMGWPATGNAYKDSKGYYSHAIPLYRKNPNRDLGVLVATVQGVVGSSNPLNFGYAQSTNKWRGEAQHAVNAYGGFEIGAGATDTINFKKKYEFHVPEEGLDRENYLSAIYRLAGEVNWSAYWVRDELHFQSQEDLFKSKARARIYRNSNGVEGVSFEWQKGKRLNTMTLNVRMERWVAPVGTVVVFDEGGPARGRWLITNIRRSVFDELGEITLSKPMREKLEPANEPGQRTEKVPNRGPGSGTPGDPTKALGTLANIGPNWTPKQIIDKLVVPKARFHGMLLGISASQVEARNRAHGGTSATTWHKGPGSLQWAADMSVGTAYPTGKMDNLAADLIMSFDLPLLANPLATNRNGNVPGNLINGYHKGFHFQLIYRTNLPQGGDHYNHVHFGVKKEAPFPSRIGQNFRP